MLAKMLRELGYEPHEAGDGKEALSALTEDPSFELALVDWNMPEMNGLELVQAVRNTATFHELKLIMVTTETEMMQVVRALEAGANEYIMKPFTKEMVAEKLQMIGLGDSV